MKAEDAIWILTWLFMAQELLESSFAYFPANSWRADGLLQLGNPDECHSILFHNPQGNAQDITQGVVSGGWIGLYTYHLGFVISP